MENADFSLKNFSLIGNIGSNDSVMPGNPTQKNFSIVLGNFIIEIIVALMGYAHLRAHTQKKTEGC